MLILTPFQPDQSTCLLNLLSPYIETDSERDVPPAADEDTLEIPKFVPMTSDVRRQLAPLVADMRAARFRPSCENDVTKPPCENDVAQCPVVALMLGGALVGGEKILNSIAEAYQDWFFRMWISRMTEEVDSAINMLQKNPKLDKIVDINILVERLRMAIKIAVKSQIDLNKVTRCTSHTVDGLKQTTPQREESSAKTASDWQQSLTNASGIAHDIATFIQSYTSAVDMAATKNDPLEAIKVLSQLHNIDFSSISSTANCLAMLNKSRAQAKGIHLHVGSMPLMVLPPALRVPFALTVNEAINNSVKYSKEDKTERHISFDAEVKDGYAVFRESDNGAGIPDMAKLVEDLREGQVVRQRPDLADGDGRGIANIVRRAARDGMGYALLSANGIGTSTCLYIDMSTLQEFKPLSKKDQARIRRMAFPMPIPSRGTPIGEKPRRIRGQPPTPEGLTAAVLDKQSLDRTLAIMGQAVSVYHYFPLP